MVNPGGGGHNAGVAHEDIEAGRVELLGCGLHGCEGCEIAFEEGEFGIGHCDFDIMDESRSLFVIAPAEVDVFWVVLCESED